MTADGELSAGSSIGPIAISPRVVDRLGERDFVPSEAGRAHVDGNAAIVIDGRGEHPALGLDANIGRPALGGDERGHAARGIAAGADLAAIGIPDAHEHVGFARGLERDDLVATDALLAVGDGADRVSRKRERSCAGIEHDEVVAEPVHLAELYRLSLHGASPAAI